jgi:hypothetical protein
MWGQINRGLAQLSHKERAYAISKLVDEGKVIETDERRKSCSHGTSTFACYLPGVPMELARTFVEDLAKKIAVPPKDHDDPDATEV